MRTEICMANKTNHLTQINHWQKYIYIYIIWKKWFIQINNSRNNKYTRRCLLESLFYPMLCFVVVLLFFFFSSSSSFCSNLLCCFFWSFNQINKSVHIWKTIRAPEWWTVQLQHELIMRSAKHKIHIYNSKK